MYEKDHVMSTNHFIAFTINLVLSLVFYAMLLFLWNSSPASGWEKTIAVFAVTQFVINLVALLIMKISILDYRFWYVFLIQMFTYGRIFLIALGKTDLLIWKNLASNYSELTNWRAGLLALTCTQCFFSGMLYVKNSYINKDNLEENDEEDASLRNLYFRLGIILIVALLPFKLITDYQNYIQMQILGVYSQAEVNGIIGNLALLYPVGFVFLICSKKWKESTCKKFIIVYSAIMLFFTIYTGDRRNVITSILAILLCYLYVYKPHIRLLKIVLYGFIAVGVLFLLVAVRELRSTSSGSLMSVIQFFENDVSLLDVLWDSFSEYGITYYTYSNAVRFYPDEIGFFLGSTYLLFLGVSIPGIGVVFPQINDLTSTSKYPEAILHYSVGGSFGQEAYANFGLFCGMFLLIVGIIFGKYFIKLLYSGNKKKILYYFLLLYFFLSLPRASFLEFSRQIVWTILITEVALRVRLIKQSRT